MKTLWNRLKNIFTIATSCNDNCVQGRYCTCYTPNISECIIELHRLASIIEAPENLEVRLIADELAKIGNRLHEKNSNS